MAMGCNGAKISKLLRGDSCFPYFSYFEDSILSWIETWNKGFLMA
jgi:hypothetical protein